MGRIGRRRKIQPTSRSIRRGLGVYTRDSVSRFGCNSFALYCLIARSGVRGWRYLNYFFIVVVIRDKTTAAAGWTLLLILRALLNYAITIALWTSFSVHDAPLDLRPSNAPAAGRSFQFGIASRQSHRKPCTPSRGERWHWHVIGKGANIDHRMSGSPDKAMQRKRAHAIEAHVAKRHGGGGLPPAMLIDI